MSERSLTNFSQLRYRCCNILYTEHDMIDDDIRNIFVRFMLINPYSVYHDIPFFEIPDMIAVTIIPDIYQNGV